MPNEIKNGTTEIEATTKAKAEDEKKVAAEKKVEDEKKVEVTAKPDAKAVKEKQFKKEVPIPPKPKKAPTFRFYRFMRAMMAPWINAIFPTTVVNRENFDKIMGGVVICNHYAVPDTLIPAIKLYKKELHVMAKAEAFQSSIGNKFLRSIGAIPVRRGEPDINAVKEVLTVLKNDKKFTIYPEGTRNKAGTEDMAHFKQGAARFAIKTKKPILPMMYYRMHKAFHRNYLYIGEPFTLEQFYGAKTSEDYEAATDYIQTKMDEVRVLLNAYVDEKTSKKKNSKK